MSEKTVLLRTNNAAHDFAPVAPQRSDPASLLIAPGTGAAPEQDPSGGDGTPTTIGGVPFAPPGIFTPSGSGGSSGSNSNGAVLAPAIVVPVAVLGVAALALMWYRRRRDVETVITHIVTEEGGGLDVGAVAKHKMAPNSASGAAGPSTAA